MRYRSALSAPLLTIALLVVSIGRIDATGTVRVQRANGAPQIYSGVSVSIVHQALRIRSKDGRDTLIIEHANCAYEGRLERCQPYSVKLAQESSMRSLAVKSGNAYLNPTEDKQPLPHSSTQIPPHGILMTLVTKTGVYIALNGTIDRFER